MSQQQWQWQPPAPPARRRMPKSEKLTILAVVLVIVAALIYGVVAVSGPITRMFSSEMQYVMTLQSAYGITSANHDLTSNRLRIVLDRQMLTCTAPPYRTVMDHQPFDCGVTVSPKK